MTLSDFEKIKIQREKQASTLGLLLLVFVVFFIPLWLFLTTYYAKIGSPIKSVDYRILTQNSLRVTWQTDFPVKTKIEYGTSEGFKNVTGMSSQYIDEGTTVISGLLPEKEHVFRIVAYDEDGNMYISNYHKVK